VDQDGDVIDILVQPHRDQRAAERFFRRLLRVPVASADLEPSLLEQLEPILGSHCDTTFLQHSLERLTYDSRTRAVEVTLMDGSRFAYTLPLAHRPGVRRRFREESGRVPRLSRLMAAASCGELVSAGEAVGNHIFWGATPEKAGE
jgi:hypothetical protein